MAIKLGDVAVFLRANTDQLQQDLNNAKGSVTNWASNLTGSMKGLVGGAVLGGVAALGTAVVGIGTAAFTAASDFDAATKKMQSQLDLTERNAERFGQALKDIYANNYGDSIEDVADSLTKVEAAFTRIGGTEGEVLQQSTQAAIALRDTFDVEVNETTRAAVELMDQFGISATEAFDLIAYGFKTGMDSSGDFLDTIGEYSTQFANGGATADQFFSIIKTGMAGGMLGTDKAADAFKEFRLRIQDGSQTTADGLKLLGINSDKLTKDLATGTITVADAFDIVLDKLREIEDPTIRMQAGAAVIGTQFEDLGDSVVRSMDASIFSIQMAAGAVESLNKQYDTIPAFFEGLRRRALVAIAPIGDAMLAVFNQTLPYIRGWFDSVESWINDFIAGSDFEWSPDIKQIKLGDLFEWVKSEGLGVQRLKLADFFDMTWSSAGLTKLTLGDVFAFSAGEGTTINLADYLHFIYDAQSGAVALTLSDVFSFVSDEGGTVINLGDYIKFKYDTETGKVTLDWDDVFTFVGLDGETHTIDLTNLVNFTYDTESGGVALTLGDVFSFVKAGEITTINLKDYLKFTFGEGEGITKLTLADFFDFSSKDGVGIVRFDLKDFLWGDVQDPITQADLFDFATKVTIGNYSLADFFSWVTGAEITKTTSGDIFDLSAKAPIDPYTIADFFDFLGVDQAKITYGDIFDFTLGADGITKLQIGDFIDVEGLTAADLFGGALSDLSKTLGGTLEELAAGLVIDAPQWVQDLVNWKPEQGAPAWVTSLLAWAWPGVPTTIASLLTWTWPGAPADISSLLAWAWPDAPADISRILAWAWPDFGAGLTSMINKVTSFKWPELKAPAWLTQLTNLTIPTPAWVTSLINALNGFELPDLNPFNNSSNANPGATSQGSIGRSLQPTVNLGPVYVNNREDAEAMAYSIARRMGGR